MKKSNVIKTIAIATMLAFSLWSFIPEEKLNNEVISVKNGLITKVDKKENNDVGANKKNDFQQNGSTQPVYGQLPPRMVGVPSYEKLVAAARIMNEAANEGEAKIFLAINANFSSQKMQNEIWKLKADTADYQARYAKSQVQVNEMAETGKVIRDESNNSSVVGSIGNYDIERNGQEKAKEIDITLRSNDSQGMVFAIGENWFRNVKVGHSIKGYRVNSYDENLDCAQLIDNRNKKNTRTVCLN